MVTTRAKILLLHIEDSPGDQAIFASLLRRSARYAFEIQAVAELAAGVTALQYRPFDVAVVDLGLPKSDPSEVISEVMRVALDVPVIVLSGNEDPEISDRAYDRGVARFHLKDNITAAMLEREITGVLRQHARQRKIAETSRQTRVAIGRGSEPEVTVERAGATARMCEPHFDVMSSALRTTLMKTADNWPAAAQFIRTSLGAEGYHGAMTEILRALMLDREEVTVSDTEAAELRLRQRHEGKASDDPEAALEASIRARGLRRVS